MHRTTNTEPASQPARRGRRAQAHGQALDDLDLPTLIRTSEPWLEASQGKGRPRRRWLVRLRCTVCAEEKTYFVENLLRGLSTQCTCQRGVKYAMDPRATRLGRRFDAIKQRCCNPGYEWYPPYGGRGIELRFASRESFVRYVLEHLPHADYDGVQIDRIDNDGHYAPGNLRLVRQEVNLRNKQASKKVDYRGQQVNAADLWHLMKTDMPWITVGPHRTAKLAAAGVPWPEIAARPGKGPRNGRAWAVDAAVVALYRDG